MILCLDLGVKTGWAVNRVYGIDSGTINFKGRAVFEGSGMKLLRFKRWLTEMKQSGVDEIYFEEIVKHSRKYDATIQAQTYGSFIGVLMAWCEHHEIPYSSVPVGSIKKFATNKGNANKQMMIDAAIAQGFYVEDDNQADAIHLLRYVIDKIETAQEVMG